MKAIVLHHYYYHYEMIPSILTQFKDYEIDLFFTQKNEDLKSWNTIYSQLNIPYNMIDQIKHRNYDLIILDTDDDKIMCHVYNDYFRGIPIYIIKHVKDGDRSNITPSLKKTIDVHGINQKFTSFHFCGFRYISVEEKLKKISNKISVAIIGDIVNEEKDFLNSLIKRVKNFNDIDFYIINRTYPYWYTKKYLNIKYFISCSTQIMFKILERCHYIYFFGFTRGVDKSSACFGLSYSTLCRMVCCDRSREQYNIETPIFKNMSDSFELKPLIKENLIDIDNERETLINQTGIHIKNLLKS